MITGIVNADFEPIIPLSVCGSDGKVYTQDAIVDTGYLIQELYTKQQQQRLSFFTSYKDR